MDGEGNAEGQGARIYIITGGPGKYFKKTFYAGR
jgi:hypothetical protein